MKILHTLTVSIYRPHCGMYEQAARHIMRSRKLTYKGAERILRREARENGETFSGQVVAMQTAIWQDCG